MNENSFTFLCKDSYICNFGIFVRIFIKFSPKCKPKKLGMIYTIWEVFAHLLIGKGQIFGPKTGLGKSLSFDSITGVKHPNIICDACKTQGIQGMRWKCTKCHDFDLCCLCYMADKHDLGHSFQRFDTASSKGSVSFIYTVNVLKF